MEEQHSKGHNNKKFRFGLTMEADIATKSNNLATVCPIRKTFAESLVRNVKARFLDSSSTIASTIIGRRNISLPFSTNHNIRRSSSSC